MSEKTVPLFSGRKLRKGAVLITFKTQNCIIITGNVIVWCYLRQLVTSST